MREDKSDRLADAIVGVLGAVSQRVECAVDGGDICYTVRSRSLMLRSVVLNREALCGLLTATDAMVKIEYLKRDLLRAAAQQKEYTYPHRAVRQLNTY